MSSSHLPHKSKYLSLETDSKFNKVFSELRHQTKPGLELSYTNNLNLSSKIPISAHVQAGSLLNQYLPGGIWHFIIIFCSVSRKILWHFQGGRLVKVSYDFCQLSQYFENRKLHPWIKFWNISHWGEGGWGVCASIWILSQEIFSSNFLKSHPHCIVPLLIPGSTVSHKSKIHSSSSRGLKWLIISLAGFLGIPQSHFQFTLAMTALAFVPLKQGSDSHFFKWFSPVPSASEAIPE